MAYSVGGQFSIGDLQPVRVDRVQGWVRPARLQAHAGRCIPRVRSRVDREVVRGWARVLGLALDRDLDSVPGWAVQEWLRRLQGKRPARSVRVLREAGDGSSIQK